MVADTFGPIVEPARPKADAQVVFPEFSRNRGSNALGLSFGELLQRDQEFVARSRRLQGCGLRSSMLSLDVLLDREETIGFGEFHYSEDPRGGFVGAQRESVGPRRELDAERF